MTVRTRRCRLRYRATVRARARVAASNQKTMAEDEPSEEALRACKRLRPAEWQKVKKAMDSCAFTIFSSATLEDVKRADGLHLNLKNIQNNRNLQPSLILPEHI